MMVQRQKIPIEKLIIYLIIQHPLLNYCISCKPMKEQSNLNNNNDDNIDDDNDDDNDGNNDGNDDGNNNQNNKNDNVFW